MATKNLTTNYLTKLTNANHDGVTQQINDRLVAFTTDNQLLVTAIQGVTAARQAEDIAYKRLSGKDFASEDLKKEDGLEDNYMSTIRGILNGLLYLPETEPMYRKAQLAAQVFKDFDFSINDGFEAEARKILNMNQQWQAATDYTLAELGIAEWVSKAVTQANKVLQLVSIRVDNESAKVKGELANARKVTDAAIRQAYDVVNALSVLQPSESLNALITVLLSIEERAKLYYISGASGAGIDKPNNGGGDNGGGDTPTPTPDPTPDPNNGGGGNNGGSGGFDTGEGTF
ncbi:MAG: hypothetical protein J6T38_03180 [Bacteroidaceae bacterium]|nr:hypothetical protein [Bacteroidaceae bacterium]